MVVFYAQKAPCRPSTPLLAMSRNLPTPSSQSNPGCPGVKRLPGPGFAHEPWWHFFSRERRHADNCDPLSLVARDLPTPESPWNPSCPWLPSSVGTRVLVANLILLPSRFPCQSSQAVVQSEGGGTRSVPSPGIYFSPSCRHP